MNSRIEHIRQRRDMLVIRADLQRLDLALQTEPWKKPLSYVDRGIMLARRVREHPILLFFAVAAIASVGRHRLTRALSLAWSAWRAYKLFRGTRSR